MCKYFDLLFHTNVSEYEIIKHLFHAHLYLYDFQYFTDMV